MIIVGILISLSVFNTIETFSISLLIFLLYGIDAIVEIFNARLHFVQNLYQVSISTILRGVASICGVTFGVLLFDSLIIGLVFSLLFKTIFFLMYDYPLFKKDNYVLKLKLKRITLVLKKALPLGIGLLIASLNVNVSKYFIEIKFGTDIQGIYSTISYIIVLGTMFVGTFGQIVLPKIAIFYLEGQIKKYRILNFKYILFTLVVGICIFCFSYILGNEFLAFFFSEKIATYSSWLLWIMGSAIPIYLSSAMGYSLTAVGILNQQVILGLVTLTCNILLNLLFVKSSSVELITLFTGISFLLQFVIGFYYFIKKNNHGFK